MPRLIRATLFCSAAILSFIAFAYSQTPTPAPPAGLDIPTIDRAIGKSGQVIGDVYKISFPR